MSRSYPPEVLPAHIPKLAQKTLAGLSFPRPQALGVLEKVIRQSFSRL